jgi:hypothetical protein
MNGTSLGGQPQRAPRGPTKRFQADGVDAKVAS